MIKRIGFGVIGIGIASLILSFTSSASPFGQGVFGADVPFGSQTSIAVSLGTAPSMTLSTDGPNTFSGSATQNLTVTSTDVVGYRLYARTEGGTAMTNGSETIPASSNISAAPLAINTWGYNTDGSANYLGLTGTHQLVKDADGPYKNGDTTNITYGARANITKGAGTYQVNVIYTVVAENQ